MYDVNECPICGGTAFRPFLQCIDHTVSHETFSLQECVQCHLVITSPRPQNSDLPKYYQSPNYISHSTTSNTLLDRAYRIARGLNLRWKLNIIRKHADDQARQLLDFGCGTGQFLLAAIKRGYIAAGVEPTTTAREFAQQLTGINIMPSLPNTANRYDIITLWHVLEHVPDLNSQLDGLASALAQNGTMFIAVPNHRSADANQYKSLWAGYDVPRHLWHFSKPTMEDLLRKHSLKLMHIVPMKLDAFYVSMLSEQYAISAQTIGATLRGVRLGLRSNSAARNTGEYSSLIYIATK